MAINKNDFKNAEGNYEAKNALMDAVIDGVNGIGETGVATFTDVVSGETVSQVISYTNTYSKAPRVVAVNSSSFPHAVFASVSDLTTTGFTINARHTIGDTRNLYVSWIAMAQ